MKVVSALQWLASPLDSLQNPLEDKNWMDQFSQITRPQLHIVWVANPNGLVGESENIPYLLTPNHHIGVIAIFSRLLFTVGKAAVKFKGPGR